MPRTPQKYKVCQTWSIPVIRDNFVYRKANTMSINDISPEANSDIEAYKVNRGILNIVSIDNISITEHTRQPHFTSQVERLF